MFHFNDVLRVSLENATQFGDHPVQNREKIHIPWTKLQIFDEKHIHFGRKLQTNDFLSRFYKNVKFGRKIPVPETGCPKTIDFWSC